MSKPPKTDFKNLIAGLPMAPQPEAPPVAADPQPAAAPSPQSTAAAPPPAREVVALKPQRPPHVQQPAGEGTLKQRAHQLSLYLEGPVYDRLREIAFHERTKLHPLILEGIDLLLKKRGAPSIKELTKKTG
jgi:hypothetical protein